MVVTPDERVGLTDDRQATERAVEACTEQLSEETPELFDALRAHTSDVAAAVADADGVPGADLGSDEAVEHFREFVRAQYDESWFESLGKRGGDLGLTWATFRTGMRRFAELLSLEAFVQFHEAGAQFQEARGRRSDAETAVEEAESALQYRNEMGGVQGEESFDALVDDARAAVRDARECLVAGEAAMRRAYAFRAAAQRCRAEYDVDDEALSFVSLDDGDADWEFRELRHGRDRLANRLNRVESDVDELRDHPRYGH
jgi:hypothetical protein